MTSPWLEIPLADYEGHMSLPSIGQADMIASEFAALLDEYAPPSLAVIGCSGGNGFDRISSQTTTRVVGIDINPAYIQRVSERYEGSTQGLELHVLDIQQPGLRIELVDLVYAALIFEYVDLEQTLRNLQALCKPNGLLVTLLQLSSASAGAVSQSPFVTLQTLSSAMRLVPPDFLMAQAEQVGFVTLSSAKITLPSGKEFAVLRFDRPAGLVDSHPEHMPEQSG